MSQSPHLFVYGTLRRGFNHPLAQHLARQAHFVGLGCVPGRLYDLGDYPGLVLPGQPTDRVLGDVYALDRPGQLLSLLDEYEEYNPLEPFHSLYLREAVTITLLAGGSRQGWLYRFNRPVKPFKYIPSGDYLSYLSLKTL
jgi:gamma-glutamylcyclotransferase (GGCT)/AIG2-like uncharacterized protein YtfP